MASSEPWESRPDRQTTKGVGVLIDPEYLSSPDKNNYDNPYYVVVNGIRYYGPNPEAAVQKAREKAPRKVMSAVPTKQVASSLPSGRTMGARARNAASQAAQGAKGVYNTMSRGAKGVFSYMGEGITSIGSKAGQYFTRKEKASGPIQDTNSIQLQTNPLFSPGNAPPKGERETNSILASANQTDVNMRPISKGGGRRRRRTRKAQRKMPYKR